MFALADTLRIPHKPNHLHPWTSQKIVLQNGVNSHYPITQTLNTPLITNVKRWLPPKYPPPLCYYINKAFKPPNEIINKHWKCEKIGYGIYSPMNGFKITKRLPGLPKNPTSKIMNILHILQLLTTTYRDELTHIFTKCFNVLYLLNTQIKHPTMHTKLSLDL